MLLPDITWLREAPKRHRYLAGISGGADSVALLHLLHRSGFRDVVVCHLNHQLRGSASSGDAKFVKKLAGSLGYVCEVAEADVLSLMAERGRSMETTAREARHAFFAKCAQVHRCPRVVLAHHADDQAETILWNLLRGSRGLSGMQEVQAFATGGGSFECLRPLLSTRREVLRDWLIAEKIRWREDATNAQPIAVRNRLRNDALPLLNEISRRDVAPLLTRTMEAHDELRAIEKWAVDQAAVVDPQGRLHLPKLRALPAEVQAACIHAFLRDAGVADLSRERVTSCLALLDAEASPAVNLPGGRFLRRRAGRLVIVEGKA